MKTLLDGSICYFNFYYGILGYFFQDRVLVLYNNSIFHKKENVLFRKKNCDLLTLLIMWTALDCKLVGFKSCCCCCCCCFYRLFWCVGDSKGNIWFNQPPNLSTWTQRRPASIFIFSHRPDHIHSFSHVFSDELFVWPVCRHTQTKWVYCGLQRASSSQRLTTEPSNCGTDELRNRCFYSCFYAQCVYQCLFHLLSVSYWFSVFHRWACLCVEALSRCWRWTHVTPRNLFAVIRRVSCTSCLGKVDFLNIIRTFVIFYLLFHQL